MPVEMVRRGAGTKFDSRKLKKTANEILKLLGERRAIAEAGCPREDDDRVFIWFIFGKTNSR